MRPVQFEFSISGRLFYRGNLVESVFFLNLCAGHEDYGQNYDRASERNKTIDLFMKNEPAEKNGHHRVYVGVGGDLRRGNVPQQPNVSRVADPGAADYQVEDGADTPQSPDYAR